MDQRVTWDSAAPANRSCVIQFGSLIRAVEVVTVYHDIMDQRRASSLAFDAHAVQHSRMVHAASASVSPRVTVNLVGGDAVLLRIFATDTSACVHAAFDLRKWRYDSTSFNTRSMRSAQPPLKI